MSDSVPNRQELENLWRERVRDAQLHLELARAFLQETELNFPDGQLPSPEAHERALRAEEIALNAYSRALRILSDLIAHGKIPDENEWLKRKGASAGGEGH